MLTMEYEGYKLVSGQCNGVNDPRINLLVKDGLQFQRINFQSDIPTVVVKVSGHTFVFFYREWRLDGKKETGGWDDQLSRWPYVDLELVPQLLSWEAHFFRDC